MSNRFFINEQLGLGEFRLEGSECHHLTHVRRFATNDEVVLFNGDGKDYVGTISQIEKKTVLIEILRELEVDRELSFHLHIASAMPKSDRTDFLIEKLTELGVSEFTPLITIRSVVKPDDSKREKLERAVIESSKQCGRNKLMKINSPSRWSDWQNKQFGFRLIAHTGNSNEKIGNNPIEQSVLIAIGPEGGFTNEEVEQAAANGWNTFSLGSRILRIETAAIAAACRFIYSNV